MNLDLLDYWIRMIRGSFRVRIHNQGNRLIPLIKVRTIIMDALELQTLCSEIQQEADL